MSTDKVLRSTFSSGGHRFYQYLDKQNIIHIEYLSKENKEAIVNSTRLAKIDDIIEIFTIKLNKNNDIINKNNRSIGTIIPFTNNEYKFASVLITGEATIIDCLFDNVFECCSDIIRWMVDNQQLQFFINYK